MLFRSQNLNAAGAHAVFDNLAYEAGEALVKLYSGELVNRSMISESVRNTLDDLVAAVNRTRAAMNQTTINVGNMWCKDKWLVGVHAQGVMIGEIDSTLAKNVDSDEMSKLIINGVPRMYRSFADIPEEIKPSVLSGLATVKMTCKNATQNTMDRTWNTMNSSLDPDNYVGRIPDQYSALDGWMAWSRGAVQWVVFDKA